MDETLLDQVHYAIHARVCDMFEVREAQQTGRVKCRDCGAPIPQPYRMGSRIHVMQGVARMPVGENVIQGTVEQVRELIETLASGPGGTPGLPSLEEWRSVYYDPVRLFKQSHSHSQVQKIAAQLGIKGRSQMPEDQLIPEILRLAPELAGKPEEKRE